MNESFEIYLSSKNARFLQEGETSNAYFTLPQIEISKEETVFVNVKAATIPYSWYNVDSNNNTLAITFDGQLFPTIYTLTPSNYNINTLIEQIKSKTNLDKILYNKQSNKLTIYHSTDLTIHSTSTALELIGFTAQADHILTNGSIESDIGINLYTTQQIIIKSNNFILNNVSSKNHSDSNCLASIPITAQPNSIIHYSNNTSKHLIHHLNNISNFHIKLHNEIGNQILLNGLHWTLTLEVFIIKNIK